MNDEVIYEYNEDCTKDVSFYDIIQSLSIGDNLKEQLLERVRDLNELKPELKHELHNYHVEIKNLKKVIKNYF